MGKSNDYLTLEEVARMLGKSDPFLKSFLFLDGGRVEAKLAGGNFVIASRDLDKLRDALPPEPKKATYKASEPEKTVHNFLTDRPPKKRVPRTEPTAQGRVPSVTGSAPSKPDLSKPKPKTKTTKKTKTKQPKGKIVSRFGGDVRSGHWLFRQIKSLDRQIKYETDRCKEAEHKNRAYDTKLLKKLIADREYLVEVL